VPSDGMILPGFALVVLQSYLIRVTDDISDYEKDERVGKTMFSKKTLLILTLCLLCAVICCAVLWKVYIMLLPIPVIMLGLCLKGIWLNIAKVAYMPIIIISLFNSVFVFSKYVFIPICILIIFDVCLIKVKGDKR